MACAFRTPTWSCEGNARLRVQERLATVTAQDGRKLSALVHYEDIQTAQLVVDDALSETFFVVSAPLRLPNVATSTCLRAAQAVQGDPELTLRELQAPVGPDARGVCRLSVAKHEARGNVTRTPPPLAAELDLVRAFQQVQGAVDGVSTPLRLARSGDDVAAHVVDATWTSAKATRAALEEVACLSRIGFLSRGQHSRPPRVSYLARVARPSAQAARAPTGCADAAARRRSERARRLKLLKERAEERRKARLKRLRDGEHE